MTQQNEELPAWIPDEATAAHVLHEALATVIPDPEDPRAAAALEALTRAQRLMAAGELALRLQHALNNPLAALLAEAQLLELESLASEHRASVERIIGLTRRVIGLVRELDDVGHL